MVVSFLLSVRSTEAAQISMTIYHVVYYAPPALHNLLCDTVAAAAAAGSCTQPCFRRLTGFSLVNTNSRSEELLGSYAHSPSLPAQDEA